MATSTIAQRPRVQLAWGPLVWIGGLHLGAVLALNPAWFSWSGLAMCFFLHWLTGGIGICLTYHRLLTHRSFALRPRWLEYLLTIIGTCASEGGAIGWVADHRRHHANSDEEHDTHTPKEGFFWAHMYWWMILQPGTEHSPEYYQKWAPDLNRDPVHRFLERIHLLFPILLFVGLYLAGGMSWLVWGGFVRSIFVLHSTWLVNSASHIWGYRSHLTRDHSTNLWWVALLTYGEGWHNNHHAFQTSARHGLRWWEVDMTYITIWMMKVCRIAYNVKLVKLPTHRPQVVAAAD
jgi:stearoyl-CoA desaturase (delta-9 desaturase)